MPGVWKTPGALQNFPEIAASSRKVKIKLLANVLAALGRFLHWLLALRFWKYPRIRRAWVFQPKMWKLHHQYGLEFWLPKKVGGNMLHVQRRVKLGNSPNWWQLRTLKTAWLNRQSSSKCPPFGPWCGGSLYIFINLFRFPSAECFLEAIKKNWCPHSKKGYFPSWTVKVWEALGKHGVSIVGMVFNYEVRGRPFRDRPPRRCRCKVFACICNVLIISILRREGESDGFCVGGENEGLRVIDTN